MNNPMKKIWGYEKSNYVVPSTIKNLGGNNNFVSKAGWSA
jgi:hypothetical protein